MLTPANGNQTGAILSDFAPFPLSQGIQITFTTYTFGGSHDGTGGNGADGIVFFLTDGTKDPPTATGAEGGSMGYSCSNSNNVYDGIAYGYLGLGIDEWGNYLNSGDNTNTGILNSNAPGGSTRNGTNPFWDNGNNYYQPERIGLRGAGNTNWAWLQSQNEDYYKGSSDITKVKAACSSGKYVSKGTNASQQLKDITYNYNAIPGGYAILPGDKSQGNVPSATNQPIANNSGGATRNPTSSTNASDIAWPITYKLTISPTGLLNFDYSYNNGAYQTVLANHPITDDNGPLPDSLRFGFSAGTGGSWNVHEITCFTASPLQAQSSAAANTESGKTVGDVQFFLASYSQNNWWGSLVANPLQQKADGTLIVGTAANWDAKCVLTGAVPCDTMTKTDPDTGAIIQTYPVGVQSPDERTLLTSTAPGSAAGAPLEWAKLSPEQQDALNLPNDKNPNDATPGANRIKWLRGDRTVEQLYGGDSNASPPGSACASPPGASPPCDLRARTYVLGDIINSSPTFVGAPGAGAQPDVFADKLISSGANPENATGAEKYSSFVTTNAERTNVVYVGGNDGYVHGFRAGSTKGGSFDSSNNDAHELVGYMPYDVLMKQAVNLADPLYKHDYLVDATPVAGDVFYDGKWHTWLVGGVGSGGSEIYALDITDPDNIAADQVIGDWDNTTLTHLGTTVGTPVIARMHNGQWAIIFGSGLVPPPGAGAPAAPTEGAYIGLIDPDTGAVAFQFLDTKATPTGVNGAAGGIAYVSQADLDGDGIADYLYAGDTQGNVWRFDVTDGDASKWSAVAKPLFVATDGTNRQPITTAILPLSVQTGLVTRAMLYFGTGQQTPQTTTASITYMKGQQTFYGIWDWDMHDWNSKAPTAKYAELTGSPAISRDGLLTQSVDGLTDATHRYLSSTGTVCWKDDPTASGCSGRAQYGWMFDLPDSGPDGTL
ncbi:MAG: pilus assembly protein, partial [Mycobacterium sp.]